MNIKRLLYLKEKIEKSKRFPLKYSLLDQLKMHEKILKEKDISDKIITNQSNLLKEQRERIFFLETENHRLSKKLEEKDYQNSWLKRQMFGNKSEISSDYNFGEEVTNKNKTKKRSRGKQKGSRGFGRQIPQGLTIDEIIVDIPDEEKYCSRCGKLKKELSETEDSYEIHKKIRIIKRIYKRKKYVSVCDCDNTKKWITAPLPVKIIPKGKFSTDFWVDIILKKYAYYIPLNRIHNELTGDELSVSLGTIVGGLIQLKHYFQPLYTALVEKSRESRHWHMDETHWKIFEILLEKQTYRWWLWVCVTKEVCVYLLDPSRSSSVPKNHLRNQRNGILNVDRLSSYNVLKENNIQLSYCWAHVRRDFDRCEKGFPVIKEWCLNWKNRVSHLFHLNNERLLAKKGSTAFLKKDKSLKTALNKIENFCQKELEKGKNHNQQEKILKRLKKYWDGLIIFADHPEIPMDNNLSERKIRGPVIGRKNYYGNGSIEMGYFSAILFSIIETLKMHSIPLRKYLTDYLNACAINNNKPLADLTEFLPWNYQKAKQLCPSLPP